MKFRITTVSDKEPKGKNIVLKDIVAKSGNNLKKEFEVDINSLQDLLNLQNQVGDLILTGDKNKPELMIYDVEY